MPKGVFVNKRAIVTGGSGGIGRAICLALAASGVDVVVHYNRSAAKATAVAQEIRALGRQAWTVQADLRQETAVNQLVADAWELTGGLDVWVNNAGVDIILPPTRHLPVAERLDLLLAVDLRATILACWAAGERMKAAGGGVILNIGWDKALIDGMDGRTAELFAAAKGGVMAFTKSLARSLAPAVRVNCVAPGWIQTEWGETAASPWQERVIAETPLGRWGQPEDIADTAVFLCSDQALFITGQIINVNGGVVS
jgi:3-oxoacyl-[acyl-carrier protein] reductase